jgi:hypothetical protein
MKTFRLIVSTRLAFFPLIFNLSFAQEVEVGAENSIISNDDDEFSEDIENNTPMDSSPSVQNDNEDAQESKIVVPLYERGYGEAEGIFSEEERIMGPQLVEQVLLHSE